MNGDRATARSRHLLILRGPDGHPQPALAGRYEDELIREDGDRRPSAARDYRLLRQIALDHPPLTRTVWTMLGRLDRAS